MTKSTNSRRRSWAARVGGIGLVLSLTAAACGGDGEPVADSPEPAEEREASSTTAETVSVPVRGGDLTVALESEVPTLLPGRAEFTNSTRNIAYAIFDPLVETGADGRPRPYLAESFQENADLTEWTVTLRPNITFHDGTPLDAQVMKTIFDQYLRAPGSTTSGSLEEVVELRVDGPLTFTYVLAAPNGAFPDLLRGPVGWPFSVQAAQAAGADAGLRPMGTGPFRLEEWIRDDRVVVTRNADYWREGLPYLDSITFRPVPDEEARIDALLAGGVDAIQSLRGSTVKAVMAAQREGFTAHNHLGDDSGVVYLNTLNPPLDDVRIRRALSYALDQEMAAEALGDDGLAPPSSQFFSEDSPWYSEEVAAAHASYDPELAKDLVEDYVNDPTRSDGKEVGMRPEFHFRCLADPSLLDLAVLVEMVGLSAGFETSIENTDQADLVRRIVGTSDTDPPYRGDYHASCFRAQNAGDPATTFAAAFGPVETEAGNHTNFTSQEIQDLIDELRVTSEIEDRYEIVEKIGILVNRNAPILWATATPAMIGARDNVQNITGWTLPDGSDGSGIPFAVTRWGEVWLE